jgi:hypothetical protein
MLKEQGMMIYKLKDQLHEDDKDKVDAVSFSGMDGSSLGIVFLIHIVSEKSDITVFADTCESIKTDPERAKYKMTFTVNLAEVV